MRKRTYIRPRNDEFVESDTALCLGASLNMSPLNNRCVVCYSGPQLHSVTRGYMKQCAPTLNAAAGMSGNNRPFVTITNGIDQQGGKGGANYTEGVAPTICSDSHGTPHGVCLLKKEVFPINSMVIGKLGDNGDRQPFGIGENGEPCSTLSTAHHHAIGVRRLKK